MKRVGILFLVIWCMGAQVLWAADKPNGEQRENIKVLKERLVHNKRLTEDQKNELVDFMKAQHAENVDFRDKQHEKKTLLFESIANDPHMSQAQKKEALKKQMAQIREEDKSHRTDQKSEKKAFVKAMGPGIPAP